MKTLLPGPNHVQSKQLIATTAVSGPEQPSPPQQSLTSECQEHQTDICANVLNRTLDVSFSEFKSAEPVGQSPPPFSVHICIRPATVSHCNAPAVSE